mmetsp:Transcript_87101/g.138200  ORF Transcript_87101/g.138200 Transcript_87101/m.138200 type:complete len:80 (+) Transcript_87101:985-1224(+)
MVDPWVALGPSALAHADMVLLLAQEAPWVAPVVEPVAHGQLKVLNLAPVVGRQQEPSLAALELEDWDLLWRPSSAAGMA